MDSSTNDHLERERQALERALEELVRRRLELARAQGVAAVSAGEQARGREPGHVDLARRWIARGEDAELSICVEDVLTRVERTAQAVRLEAAAQEVREHGGERGTLLLLGALGGMGSWFRRFLTRKGYTLHLMDPAFAELPAREGAFATLDAVGDVSAYSAVLLCTPLDVTGSVIELLAERAPGVPVVEMASIKAGHEAAVRRARERGLQVFSIHPMFGPNKPLDQELCFVLACQDDPEIERRRVRWLLDHPMTRIVCVPFEHHDRLMGWLLGLAHLSGMAFALAITRSGLDASELNACASTTYERQAQTARSILGEDPQLYFDIQRRNPFQREVYAALQGALSELIESVEHEEAGTFRQLLECAREGLD